MTVMQESVPVLEKYITEHFRCEGGVTSVVCILVSNACEGRREEKGGEEAGSEG